MPKATEKQFEEALDRVIKICENLNHPEAWRWVVCYLAQHTIAGIKRLNQVTAASIQRDVVFCKEQFFVVEVDTPMQWTQDEFVDFIKTAVNPD